MVGDIYYFIMYSIFTSDFASIPRQHRYIFKPEGVCLSFVGSILKGIIFVI